MGDNNHGKNYVDISSDNNRDTFDSKLGFILACIGSAVGMGNIWMFPYRVGQLGGAAFLVPYFIFIIVIGFTGVIGEMSFGRAMGTGPLGAFKKALERRGKKHGDIIGLIPVIGSLGIAIGYSVVVGWILRFTVGAITGSMTNASDSGAYFGAIAGKIGSLSWHMMGLALTFIVMIAGVSNGIEKVNKVLMPAFFGLFFILAIRVATLPGAMEGYKYLFIPRWKFLGDPKTWVYALGQAFFSLSLAGSGTLVYGSYLKKSEDVVESAKYVAIFDTIAAMLAALVIIPSVFAFKMDPAAGPPLMFITMPSVFKQMPMGQLFSIIFFIAVLFAGVTSLMNLFETPIEALQNKFKLSRKTSVAVIALFGAITGIVLEDSNKLGVWMDVISIYVIPLGALLAAIMFYWVCGSKFAKEQVQLGREKELGSWFEPMTRYVFCGLTIIVYILGIFYGGIG
ncbi:NSS family neurotransmitter:Na+ symporter [Clostridium tetanomorphum]|uniref:Sodium-dependent transporter n=1 Tax=Clostridium tetanomorphum TaxID=1553 RepID=A0A923E7T3_CLOTT|nr:sodium-dependent transporter [Clostridium tetanomorphum]KAJ52613.1 sodium- and chloride- dependent transporter [Clostridium tetanomorphum DSM 665]MBC2396832.1 sodium-dependent transporter [Clostridium tetanomorphum]MBP1863206.1 NSS family neurotransmitter:Na+ symporter [Clostridium tetanomorphum]NRS84314.1 NSS family neurotransmitter:Na+ symporter [Clostridium tetanomorphum]NRZ97528.1 NSS family neurotransmitter:Na+ symporter [Clostridium tetanomorphum]